MRLTVDQLRCRCDPSNPVFLNTKLFLVWDTSMAAAVSLLWPRRGGETPHMKVVGMLVVSLRGVNFGFWSHLGCSGQNAIIFSREGLV